MNNPNYPTEQFRYVLESSYKALNGFDKEVPEGLTLKELVELMVVKLRNDNTISDNQMALNVYSTCLGALLSKDYAFKLRINKEGIDCQVSINHESCYL